MSMVYQWKESTGGMPVSAQVAGMEIDRIRDNKGEYFTPHDVVVASISKTAPLHPAFEWNDVIAASKFRDEQAKYIIRHLIVVKISEPDEQDAPPIRAYVSIRDEDDKQRYTTTTHAMSKPHLREQVLEQALRDLRAFERRYSEFLDLSGVMSAFETARERALSARVPEVVE